MKHRTMSALALIAVLGVAACDDPAVVGGDLSEAEAEDLASLILGTVFTTATSGPVTFPVEAGGPQLQTITSSVDTQQSCPGGGTVRITGDFVLEINDLTGAVAMTWDVVQAHAACSATSQRGRQFTLTSTLAMGIELESLTGDDFTLEGTISGPIQWSSGARSGSCAVAYNYTAELVSQTSISVSASGVVCGTTISQQYTYTVT